MASDTSGPLYGQQVVSPEQLKLRRQMLADLLKQGQDTSPIRSPWQGAARLAQTLVGVLGSNSLDTKEREARESFRDRLTAAGDDRAKLRALALDPLATEGQSRALMELSTPRLQEAGAQTVPINPSSGRQMAPPIQHIVPLSESAGDVSRTRLTNPGQEGAMPAPAPRAGGPAPPPQGATFQQRVDPLAETSRELLVKHARTVMNIDAWNEDMKAARAAPQAIQQLEMIKDLAKTYNPTTGAAAPGLQALKQSVNGLFGRDVLGETAPQEMLGKINRTLASQLAAGYSKRGMTNMDLETQLNAVPGGYATSNKGTIALADSLIHMKRQEQKLGLQFGEFKDPDNYMKNRNEWFQKPENALVNPLTGKSMSAGGWGYPDAAANHLRANPGLRGPFDTKYGSGAADSVLGGPQ